MLLRNKLDKRNKKSNREEKEMNKNIDLFRFEKWIRLNKKKEMSSSDLVPDCKTKIFLHPKIDFIYCFDLNLDDKISNASWVGMSDFEQLTYTSPFTIDRDKNIQPEISKWIIKKQPFIPNHISKVAKGSILKLLTKHPKHRLGAKDLEDIKYHPSFGPDINWHAIAQKRVPAMIKRKSEDEADQSKFVDEFSR